MFPVPNSDGAFTIGPATGNPMKRAIIFGSGGQDGSYLFERLATGENIVVGIARTTLHTFGKLEDLPGSVDILDPIQVMRLIELVSPDEIYYLAAFHHSAEDKTAISGVDLFRRSYETHVLGLIHVLEAMRTTAKGARLFYAASSHVFGDALVTPQNEQTPLQPRCVYGITKVSGIHACRFYRRTHGVKSSVGILYNHESPRRRADFFSQKIVRAAVAIQRKTQSTLIVGNLSARVDWGYAPDYVDAMMRILDFPEPTDFVVATGQLHTVQDFIELAFRAMGLDWRNHVEESAGLIAKAHAIALTGDASALRSATAWRPSVNFEEMVALLVQAEVQRDLLI